MGLALATLVAVVPAPAQTWSTNDPVLKQMWEMGMNDSQVPRMAQQLTDSIGPRLTGSSGLRRGNDWAAKTLTGFGVQARNEQYGTWRGWDRGIAHIDMVQPRVRTLEGTMMALEPRHQGEEPAGLRGGRARSTATRPSWTPGSRRPRASSSRSPSRSPPAARTASTRSSASRARWSG